jgi:plasmid stability protein
MGQLTLRLPDELVERVRSMADQLGRSMNDYASAVLDAATNPNFADSEAERVRVRLRLAGLLAPASNNVAIRPPRAAVAAARKRAGAGTSLAQLVDEGR